MTAMFVEGQDVYVLNGARNGVKAAKIERVDSIRLHVRVPEDRGAPLYVFSLHGVATGSDFKERPPVLVPVDEPRALEIRRRVEIRSYAGTLQALASAYSADPSEENLEAMREHLNQWEYAMAGFDPNETIHAALERRGESDIYRPKEEL